MLKPEAGALSGRKIPTSKPPALHVTRRVLPLQIYQGPRLFQSFSHCVVVHVRMLKNRVAEQTCAVATCRRSGVARWPRPWPGGTVGPKSGSAGRGGTRCVPVLLYVILHPVWVFTMPIE